METLTKFDTRGVQWCIEHHMEINAEDIIAWIITTRTAQGLRGTVTTDPGLHARTVAAVERHLNSVPSGAYQPIGASAA